MLLIHISYKHIVNKSFHHAFISIGLNSHINVAKKTRLTKNKYSVISYSESLPSYYGYSILMKCTLCANYDYHKPKTPVTSYNYASVIVITFVLNDLPPPPPTEL